MTELTDTFQEIPLAGLVPLGLALIVGLILWAAGRRILRVGFSALGMLAGFSIGWVLGESLNLGAPSWMAGIAGAVLLAAVAAVLYRMALAAAMAVILAVAGPLAAVTVYELQGNAAFVDAAPSGEDEDGVAADSFDVGDNEQAPGDEDLSDQEDDDPWWEREEEEISDELRRELLEQAGEETRDELRRKLGPEFEAQFDQVQQFSGQLAGALAEAWGSVAGPLKPILIGAAVAGGLLGFVAGAFMPTICASVVTAFGGSLLWITALRVLSERLGTGDAGILPGSGRGWVSFWLVAALLGLAIQWMIGRKEADNSG